MSKYWLLVDGGSAVVTAGRHLGASCHAVDGLLKGGLTPSGWDGSGGVGDVSGIRETESWLGLLSHNTVSGTQQMRGLGRGLASACVLCP
jgi:hypothetical protein